MQTFAHKKLKSYLFVCRRISEKFKRLLRKNFSAYLFYYISEILGGVSFAGAFESRDGDLKIQGEHALCSP